MTAKQSNSTYIKVWQWILSLYPNIEALIYMPNSKMEHDCWRLTLLDRKAHCYAEANTPQQRNERDPIWFRRRMLLRPLVVLLKSIIEERPTKHSWNSRIYLLTYSFPWFFPSSSSCLSFNYYYLLYIFIYIHFFIKRKQSENYYIILYYIQEKH